MALSCELTDGNWEVSSELVVVVVVVTGQVEVIVVACCRAQPFTFLYYCTVYGTVDLGTVLVQDHFFGKGQQGDGPTAVPYSLMVAVSSSNLRATRNVRNRCNSPYNNPGTLSTLGFCMWKVR